MIALRPPVSFFLSRSLTLPTSAPFTRARSAGFPTAGESNGRRCRRPPTALGNLFPDPTHKSGWDPAGLSRPWHNPRSTPGPPRRHLSLRRGAWRRRAAPHPRGRALIGQRAAGRPLALSVPPRPVPPPVRARYLRPGPGREAPPTVELRPVPRAGRGHAGRPRQPPVPLTGVPRRERLRHGNAALLGREAEGRCLCAAGARLMTPREAIGAGRGKAVRPAAV